jgi:membrane protease YdiL (CAAX protease family)
MNEKLKSAWVYFAATYAWTYLFWLAAILTGANMETGQGIVLLLLGLIGPMVTGIAFTYLTKDAQGRRSYWMRIIDVRRIPAVWYGVVFLLAPVLNLLAALLDRNTGGSGATWGEAAQNVLNNPLSIVFSLMFATVIPFIEELGWRGYSLDRLQEKHNALVSSLILGVVWSLWHLPLFFVPGSYQNGLGLGTLASWLFFLGIIPLNLVFTWIYNNTSRSILAVILFHAMVNFSGEVIALSERADTIATLLWFAAATGIVLVWGPATFRRKQKEVRDDASLYRA